MSHPGRRRVALLVNLIAPYRAGLYDELARYLDLEIIFSGNEDNRVDWDDTEHRLSRARARRSWGWVFKRDRPGHAGHPAGEPFDVRYVHITPGYALDLVRFRPDIILTSELGFRTLVAISYGLIAHVPVWVMVEASPYTERCVGPARAALRRLMLPLIHHWIAVGECSRQYLDSIHVAPSHVTMVQNTVDETPFIGARNMPKPRNARPLALCVGQLIPRKGVAYLLEAVRRLTDRGVALDLILAGDGPARGYLEARTRDLGLTNVQFLGRQTQPDLAALYRTADFLVFPTLEDVWGLVVNEALWSGLPVIASQYAGCAHELLPSDNIFDPLDPASFENALMRAAVDGLAAADTSRLWPIARAASHLAEALTESGR